MKKYAMILVGGSGTRLWPMSRKNYPKQFVEFKDGKSLFQMTILRLLAIFKASEIVLVSGADYKFTICNQIDMIDGLLAADKSKLKKNLVLEPCARNTLPAIMLGTKFLEQNRSLKDEDVLYVFPSDHIIEPISKFKASLNQGAKAASKDNIVVFGIKPDTPKEGFGYILPMSEDKVKAFVEKPVKKKAEALIKQGALWNAGIFCLKKIVFVEELEKYQPKLFAFYSQSYEKMLAGFDACVKDSIDYGIMQKTDRVSVVEFLPRWSDLGSWDSLMDFYSDGKKNFSLGRTELHDCKDCLTYSKDRLISMVGVEDLILVDSPDSVLVMKKGQSDRVKELVVALESKNASEVQDSMTVYRPWGYYTILEERPGYKVKEIGVYVGRSISLQKHKCRSEHWNIVEGKAIALIGADKLERGKNQSVYVPKNTKHKLINNGKNTLKIIEVQIGDYLEEDDIVRFDSYESI